MREEMGNLLQIRYGAWRSAGGLVWWETRLGPAALVFSTRVGGGSSPPHDELNLGLHVGDAPAAVVPNRQTFWAAAAPGAAAPVLSEQVHGAHVAVVSAADAGRGWTARETEIPQTDALVTREAGMPLGILVADCAPVAIVSPGGALAVVHAGWRGLVDGVIEAALQQMADLGGGAPAECQAVIGPCIRGCCYEVGEEVWHQFPEACLAPAARPAARRLDLMAAVNHRLREAGLPAAQIRPLGLCTGCHPQLFFSHRRATQEGMAATGRMALFAWLAR
jgi:YfiH family protein